MISTEFRVIIRNDSDQVCESDDCGQTAIVGIQQYQGERSVMSRHCVKHALDLMARLVRRSITPKEMTLEEMLDLTLIYPMLETNSRRKTQIDRDIESIFGGTDPKEEIN